MTTPAQRSAAIEPVRWRWAAALVVGIFLVYQPAWRGDFIWDDDAHLTAHRCIVGPLGFKEIWTTSEANYFPLVLTTFWVLNKIFGLNPVVYHLAGIAFHAASAVLLWAVLRRFRVRGAGLGAALWAFHPVAVESVAWISEIVNTQSAVFFLLSLWFAGRWLAPDSEAGPRRTDYAFSLLCALGAMLSKPSTVMLPVVLALGAWWLRGRLRGRDSAWLAPFFLMAFAASAWTIWEQKVHQGAAGAEWNQTLVERFIIAGRAPWFYLAKLLWPHPLSFVYPRWTLDGTAPVSYLPLAATLAAGAMIWWRRTTSRPAFAAAVIFIALLFPVLGFFSVYYFRYAFVADHFQYVAAIGPLALLAAGIFTLAERQAGLAHGIAVLVVFLLAGLSWRQARNYRDDETLWRATLRTNPHTFLAHNNLGAALMAAGKNAEAVEHFERVLVSDPNLAETHFNAGKSLLALPARRAEALGHFAAAVRLKPGVPQAHLALANLLAADPGRRPDAIAQYEVVLQVEPDNADAHTNLGLLLGAMPGRLDDAIHHGEAAVKLQPNSPEAHFNLANNLARRSERVGDAIAHHERALQLRPDYLKAHINLGIILMGLPARMPEAIRHYESALALDPTSAVAHNNLAIALAQSGRRDEAIAHFEQALQIDPGYTAARNNLAQLKARRP
ncbi:MAG TPA: tetratricopeptide repeat protein [Opitutaceae bacterium]|nr:tetratricopeptide repeat protein [Opitutaceae bacterium]